MYWHSINMLFCIIALRLKSRRQAHDMTTCSDRYTRVGLETYSWHMKSLSWFWLCLRLTTKAVIARIKCTWYHDQCAVDRRYCGLHWMSSCLWLCRQCISGWSWNPHVTMTVWTLSKTIALFQDYITKSTAAAVVFCSMVVWQYNKLPWWFSITECALAFDHADNNDVDVICQPAISSM